VARLVLGDEGDLREVAEDDALLDELDGDAVLGAGGDREADRGLAGVLRAGAAGVLGVDGDLLHVDEGGAAVDGAAQELAGLVEELAGAGVLEVAVDGGVGEVVALGVGAAVAGASDGVLGLADDDLVGAHVAGVALGEGGDEGLLGGVVGAHAALEVVGGEALVVAADEAVLVGDGGGVGGEPGEGADRCAVGVAALGALEAEHGHAGVGVALVLGLVGGALVGGLPA
jgi:hypothetical protein